MDDHHRKQQHRWSHLPIPQGPHMNPVVLYEAIPMISRETYTHGQGVRRSLRRRILLGQRQYALIHRRWDCLFRKPLHCRYCDVLWNEKMTIFTNDYSNR